MPVASEPPRAVYAAAVETLCGGVVRALTGADDAFRLADELSPENSMAGLAAVRVLGADALTPFTLGGHPFGPDDAAVIATSIATFPPSGPDFGCHEGPMPVRQLRDWATSQLLARLGSDDFAHSYPARTGSGSGPEPDWVEWTATLAQLSPLASPGLVLPSMLMRSDAGWTRRAESPGQCCAATISPRPGWPDGSAPAALQQWIRRSHWSPSWVISSSSLTATPDCSWRLLWRVVGWST